MNGKEQKFKDLFERAQRGEPIDLLALEDDEGPELILPNRRKFRVRLFDGEHYQLYEKVLADGAAGKAKDEDVERLMRFAIPGLTAEELGSLSPIQGQFICKAAARQADGILFLLRKNAERPVPQPPALAESTAPQPSTRKTKRSTTSRGSQKPSPKQAGSGP